MADQKKTIKKIPEEITLTMNEKSQDIISLIDHLEETVDSKANEIITLEEERTQKTN
jgi:hypothetical protein